MKKNKIKSNGQSLIKSDNLFPVIGVGASAGGLDAFRKLLSAIPVNSGMAYVLVQHLHPSHESMLPELLQKVTPIPVMEITDDIKILPDHIYIIPSNKMLIANDGKLELNPRIEKENSLPRPGGEKNLTIDLFFYSLAEVHQSHAIGVVLSGTASDGTLGLKAIKDQGGITFAQDETSAEYEGMPHSAVQAGVVDFILPPEQIPQKILELTKITNGNGNGVDENDITQPDDEVFRQILSLLRIRKGTDFTYYKQTTIRRRILRRMALNKNEEPTAYLKFLRENKKEQDVLYQDLLIPVTNFFRDSKSFDSLKETVLPRILKNKTYAALGSEPIRVWVAGCSTGEEAYSIAICIKEYLSSPPYSPDSYREGHDEVSRSGAVQIFATDISEPAVAKARTGIYSKSEVQELTPQRLQTFFTKSNGDWQLNKEVRDMCVFAVHNFLKNPPFGKMDFISCRNVLIYMEPYLQKKALTTFHYSLNKGGFLFLGKSETITSAPGLFSLDANHDKIFPRKDVPARFMQVASQRSEQILQTTDANKKHSDTPGSTDFQKTADYIMLSRYTPAGVVVNEAMDIVHFRGSTAPYLEQAQGKPTHNLLKMAKHGLAFEIRNILHKAKKQNAAVTKENIPVQAGDSLHKISIEAIPLPNTIEPHYLILFHDVNVKSEKPEVRKKKNKTKEEDKDLRVEQLERELAQSREDMRGITEDQEAANEELLSSSEELQTLNEELETGKEELQSTNEELSVVNQELVNMNEQITAARDYAENIISTIRHPLLVLDKNLRVKTANPSFYKTFGVNEQETEGTLIYDLGNQQWDIPLLRKALEEVLPLRNRFKDWEVRHSFQEIGERIMLLNAKEIKSKAAGEERLILLAIEDVTERIIAEQKNLAVSKKIEQSEQRYSQIFRSSPVSLWEEDFTKLTAEINRLKTTGITDFRKYLEDNINESWRLAALVQIDNVNDETMRMLEAENQEELLVGLSLIFTEETLPVFNEEVILVAEGRTKMTLPTVLKTLKGKRIEALFSIDYDINPGTDDKKALVSLTDITIEKENERVLRESEQRFRQMADLMPQKVWTADAEGNRNYFNKQWIDYTGFSLEDLKNDGWKKIVHPDDLAATDKLWQQSVATGNAFEVEDRKRNKEGQYKWHLSRASAFKSDTGKIIKWIGTNTEMEKHKKHSIELEKAVTHRTYELQKANQLLEEKNIELQKMNKELESFTYISSHDLQEPLRKIQTFAGRVMEKENQNLSETGKDYFRRMQQASQRMQTLIQDLLSFSRLSTTERKFETTNLNTVIEEVKRDFKEIITENNATIEAGKLCETKVIPFQFYQLMHNLIGNALKFSNPDMPPHIMIKDKIAKGMELNNPKLLPEKKYCHITITDNGIGFEPEFSEKIFEVFQKLHGKEEYAGTGIGLAIVKKIVENHNGIVTAAGELGKGARFDIYIPKD